MQAVDRTVNPGCAGWLNIEPRDNSESGASPDSFYFHVTIQAPVDVLHANRRSKLAELIFCFDGCFPCPSFQYVKYIKMQTPS